jgi:hypothetical protein
VENDKRSLSFLKVGRDPDMANARNPAEAFKNCLRLE